MSMQQAHDDRGPDAQNRAEELPAESEPPPGAPAREEEWKNWKNDVLRKVSTLLDLLNRRSTRVIVFF